MCLFFRVTRQRCLSSNLTLLTPGSSCLLATMGTCSYGTCCEAQTHSITSTWYADTALPEVGFYRMVHSGKLLTPAGWSENMMRSECDSFAITLNCEGLKEQCSCFGQGASLHTVRGKWARFFPPLHPITAGEHWLTHVTTNDLWLLGRCGYNVFILMDTKLGQ